MIVLATNDATKMAQLINGFKVVDLDAGGLKTGGVLKPKPEAGLVDEFKTDGVLQKSVLVSELLNLY